MKGIRFFQSIQAKLIIVYVLLILIAMQLIGVYFYKTVETYFKNDFLASRNSQVTLLAGFVGSYLTGDQDSKNAAEGKKTYADLNEFVSNLFSINNAEIQIIDANGNVISTSVSNHLKQKNTQPEVIRALQGIKDNQRIFTDEDGYRKVIIAKPVGSGARVLGAVYIIASMEDVYKTIRSINRILISGTLIALGLTAILGVLLTSTITNPIKEITRQATAVAEGNFDQQVIIQGTDEIGQLGQTFNFMMNRLKEALYLNEEEKEKLASILTNMNDGVIATDDKGHVIVLNRRAKQILQTEEETTLGLEISEVLGIPMDTIRGFIQGHVNTTLLDIELPDDDEQLSVRITFTPIHRRGEGQNGIIAVLQDVTDQEKLEQARREFVANVSHELRTPLTTIKSYLEALDDGAIEEPQLASRFISVTRSETERMIRLVTDLLHLSRLDSKQSMMSKSTTLVSEMLEEVADRFSFQLQQRKIEIVIQVEQGVTSLLLDRDKIDQVLDNLVSNAIKYTGDEGAIRLEARKIEKDVLEISVQDNGIGIPKKDLSRIFDRFYRVDKARSRNMGGTGLGLSIAREIVKAHGGSISLESELGQGTRVIFTLPIQQEEEDEL
ncbi:two-component system, OmpR family, sensor histidine kinase VicK [Paenibacillus sp. yr247]|uniref:cell wall metabolism sensor histidine kinase WalK n=1 Tax=Paenibacillus sp. yr247 TaxID=1761880 RepID=UPI00088C9260|nr:cell wall metabolism sensor histidine kinase WalK [Paenibacillus sp. yr247]SDO53403.1 two-component system, OmpR family, sensor histidine kinase VicK [Paenibacillus sp. yr247]